MTVTILFALAAGAAGGGDASPPVRGICWIADVTVIAPDRLRLSFDRTGPLSVVVQGRLWIPRDAPGPGTEPAAVEVGLGDHLSATGGVHDNCMLSVERRDGRIGVAATATLALPDLPARRDSAFYPAR